MHRFECVDLKRLEIRLLAVLKTVFTMKPIHLRPVTNLPSPDAELASNGIGSLGLR